MFNVRAHNQNPVLYSYVVEHDNGYAPNPESGLCTLVHCKFQKRSHKRRNIVELANVGDWILGTGGVTGESAGNNKIIYFMRVDEKILFSEYLSGTKYKARDDCEDNHEGNKFALLSTTYFYFGQKAIDINNIPLGIPYNQLVKKGPGYRNKIPVVELEKLVNWFMNKYSLGMHGMPCNNHNKHLQDREQFKLLKLNRNYKTAGK